MIDVAAEETDTLAGATKWVPRTGEDAQGRRRKASASTLWRWAEHGVSGIKLETIFVGSVRYTSREALQRFFERVTAARAGGPTGSAPTAEQPDGRTRTESQRRKAASKAGEKLAEMIRNPPRPARQRRPAASAR